MVGAGVFGHHHATKYKALSQAGQSSGHQTVELFAIADPNADILAKAGAHYGCKATADWRDLLGKVDLVSICSPAVTHAEIVRAFLNAGAHVLVEKPIATTLEEAAELTQLARDVGKVLTVGHQERFVFARTGLLDLAETPLEITCWRQGPWTGRGDDVSVVLDLMIHDLDLVHTLVPGAVTEVRAEGLIEYGPHADEVFAIVNFACGTIAKLETSRIATERKRGMRAVYADGVVEIDFLSRTVTNTTPRPLLGIPLGALELGDPLGEAVAGFVIAATAGTDALVTPEQAVQALQTALLVEQASGVAVPASARVAAGR